MYIIILVISLFASIVGAICGIGGGVIIKPALDMFSDLDVTTISFLSGCTVLAMSSYSIIKTMIVKESKVNIQTCTPLAIGAALGGVVGKYLFTLVSQSFFNENIAGAVQSIFLVTLTLCSLLYTVLRSNIKSYRVTHKSVLILIGLLLGIISSFLGIGGGPFNLIVLYFFFSMGVKEAAQSSLYIILFSQVTSLINSLIRGNHQDVSIMLLIGMIACGILGAIIGRHFNKKMNEHTVSILFKGSMVLIIFISFINIFKYLG